MDVVHEKGLGAQTAGATSVPHVVLYSATLFQSLKVLTAMLLKVNVFWADEPAATCNIVNNKV